MPTNDNQQPKKSISINYKDADGKILELEVSEEVGTFYLESIEAEKKNDRKNSRIDRHTSLEKVERYLFQDADGHAVLVFNRPDQPKHVFNHEAKFESQITGDESISHLLSCLNERQQYLIQKCCIQGWSYTELAKLEGKDESAIRGAVKRAKNKLKKILS
ncbi:hypothetical protein JCM15765_24150 [Paradesulfitobacterium aromaticivorans]